jgi:hypothetical protein
MSRKVFTAGEVLAAADVNSFLMDQTVMSFAGTAARGSAIPSPVEGMNTYLEDSNDYESYDGSNWIPLVSLGAWKSYAPNFNDGDWVQGNGTFTEARYVQIGKTVHFAIDFLCGNTTVEGSSLRISLPVSAVASNQFFGVGAFLDGATRYSVFALANSSTSVNLGAVLVNATYATNSNVSATVPFTWGDGDRIRFTGTYEAA